jgi:hypothetical protein
MSCRCRECRPELWPKNEDGSDPVTPIEYTSSAMTGFNGFVTSTRLRGEAEAMLTRETLQRAMDNLRDHRPPTRDWGAVADNWVRQYESIPRNAASGNTPEPSRTDIERAIEEYTARARRARTEEERRHVRQMLDALHHQHANMSYAGLATRVERAIYALQYLRWRDRSLTRIQSESGEEAAEHFRVVTRVDAERNASRLGDLNYSEWNAVERRWQELHLGDNADIALRRAGTQGQG